MRVRGPLSKSLVRPAGVLAADLVCLLLACIAAVGLGAAPAGAALPAQFGEAGTGAGQFAEPEGVAVDQASGDVYVVDKNNQRVEQFDATGGFLTAWGWGVADGTTQAFQACTTTCFAGIEGSGAGQFHSPEGVAVDNSTNPLDLSVGDVYVVDVRNERVEKFSPSGAFLLMFGGEVNETTKGDVCVAGEKCKAGIEGSEPGQFKVGRRSGEYIAVGSTGTVYVGDESRVQEFSPEGVYQSQVALASAGPTTALAVDSAGDIYVKRGALTSGELTGVQEYDPSGTLLKTLDFTGDPRALAVDSSDDLFVDDGEDSQHRILKYDSSGKELSSFDEGTEGGTRGIAFGDTAGVLYVVNPSVVRLVAVPPSGPIVEPGSESASEVRRTIATLNATVDPEGHEESSSEEATYRFEYGETESYGSSTPLEASIGGSFEDRTVSASLTGLLPGRTYHYRVVVSNAAHETTDGPDETFTTLPALSIDGEFVSDVTSSSVTFGALINPLGSEKEAPLDTTYRFEYDTSPYEGSARHGTSLPVPDGDAGSGSADVTVAPEHVQNLLPGMTYHYRVVASNGLGTVEGPDRTFTTQPAGVPPVLPDGRQWEMVSPPDKHGALLESLGYTVAEQAAVGGGAMSYFAIGATELGAQGQAEGAQVFSTRGASGWSSRDIATPHNGAVGLAPERFGEYLFFSEDLSRSLVEPTEPARPFSSLAACTATGCVPESFPEATESTPYVRHNGTCASEVSSCYEPLLTGASGYADVQPGVEFANESHGEFLGAAPDLNSVVLGSEVGLTPGAPQHKELYEWSAGAPATERLQLVSVLPQSEGGGAVTGPAGVHLGGSNQLIGSGWRPVSANGSRVFWTGPGLFMRDTAKGETIRLDPPGVAGEKVFQAASSDGSKAFFTDAGDLYVCEIVEEAGRDACKLTDLTPAGKGQSAGVGTLMPGTSDDGSYAYFVARSVLSSGENGEKEKAVPGEHNLYMVHRAGTEWVTTFIATLSQADEKDWGNETPPQLTIGVLTARVSPDGRYLAFMSNRPLTGYDNNDALTGKPDQEVYLHDAGSGSHPPRLVCASCNPTGARPVGVEAGQIVGVKIGAGNGNLVDITEGVGFAGGFGEQTGIAANIPGGDRVDDRQGSLYQPRYLSDSGRLFFNSSDALVPQDVNGQEDVYQYEPVGVGGCTVSSLAYSVRSGGCVDLVSSGLSPAESGFMDASATGGDVFFLTKAKLLSSDFDTALDVYDAHECTSQAPCYPVSSSLPPACDSAESCRVAPSPQPGIFGSPPSATFSGAGNAASSVGRAEPRSKTAARVRAEKLRRALAACRKKPRRVQGSCRARARARYGGKSKVKNAGRSSRGAK